MLCVKLYFIKNVQLMKIVTQKIAPRKKCTKYIRMKKLNYTGVRTFANYTKLPFQTLAQIIIQLITLISGQKSVCFLSLKTSN